MGPDYITEYLQDTDPWLIGTFCATTLYGVLAVLYAQTIAALFTQRRKSRWTYVYPVIATVMFGLGTINIVAAIRMYRAQAVALALDVAVERYPDIAAGTNGLKQGALSPLSTVAFFLAIWLQDGLLLYRCLMTWGRNWVVILFPSVLYLTSVGISIAMLSSTDPETITAIIWIVNNPSPSESIELAVFWPFSIVLNILLTSLIAGRIMYLKAIIRKAVGPYHAKIYTSVMALIIESAALYTTFAALYFISLVGLSNRGVRICMQLNLSIIEVITPLLIIHRIASGKAFSNRTLTETGGDVLTVGSDKQFPGSNSV